MRNGSKGSHHVSPTGSAQDRHRHSRSEDLKAEHTRYVSAGVGQGMPVFAETASGSTITDVDGNRFIDLASGIAVTGVGNCAPEVVAAVQEEVAKLTHTTTTASFLT